MLYHLQHTCLNIFTFLTCSRLYTPARLHLVPCSLSTLIPGPSHTWSLAGYRAVKEGDSWPNAGGFVLVGPAQSFDISRIIYQTTPLPRSSLTNPTPIFWLAAKSVWPAPTHLKPFVPFLVFFFQTTILFSHL